MIFRRGRGFTLIELLVVVVIAALLLVLALPSYQRQLRSARRAMGSAALLDSMARQQQFFVDHKRYANSLTELGFPASPYAIDPGGNKVSVASARRIYLIELGLHPAGYALYARPQLARREIASAVP